MEKLEISLDAVPKVGNGVYHLGGRKIFISNGVKHRENGPAVIGNDGYEAYYYNGVLHNKKGW